MKTSRSDLTKIETKVSGTHTNSPDIVINSNVPLPLLNHRFSTRSPFSQIVDRLEVTQSFFVAGDKMGQLCNMTTYRHKTSKKRFTVRTVIEDGIAGTRLWRTQ